MSERRTVADGVLEEAWYRGERVAIGKLFERHYASVARFFRNKVSEAAQEELIRETFLACLAGTPGVTHAGRQAPFRIYLFGMAHQVLMEHLRRTSRSGARPGTEAAPMTAAPRTAAPRTAAPRTAAGERSGPSPAGAAQDEPQRLLLEALQRIPLLHQVTLELHYWEGLTAAEIADVLGVPLGTAQLQLRDGRVYLEEQLRPRQPARGAATAHR